ncbi:MAG: PAS domain-containing protein [Desulfobulbaceae bacterium]|nr:PAS domain-containing protein [Desulfobulbaceae bacterium]
MEFTRWDDFLVAEHEMIERAMAVFKQCLDNLDASVKNPVQMMRAMDFLLEFGDKIHNRKEEELLFPLMQRRGIPVEGGPLGVMLMEHQAERELLGGMLIQAKELKHRTDDEKEQYRSKGLEYLKIRAEHIWKENDVLFKMGLRVTDERDNANLLQGFAGINSETYGQTAGEKFQQMLQEVEEGTKPENRLIENLSYDQIHAIMEAMPFEVTFVDSDDVVAYFNRLDREKLFPRTRSVIGRKVEKCHPEKSVDVVNAIVEGFKNKTRDTAEFWIDFRGDKILIRYFPVYDDEGKYMGVLEVTQAIGWIQGLEGQKRLLD